MIAISTELAVAGLNPKAPSSFDTDVLIVGAGPTGLTLAAALCARGVKATVIDRLAEGANTSRAAAVHARTLEVLEGVGVSVAQSRAEHAVMRAGVSAPARAALVRSRVSAVGAAVIRRHRRARTGQGCTRMSVPRYSALMSSPSCAWDDHTHCSVRVITHARSSCVSWSTSVRGSLA